MNENSSEIKPELEKIAIHISIEDEDGKPKAKVKSRRILKRSSVMKVLKKCRTSGKSD